jgi:MFS family permease
VLLDRTLLALGVVATGVSVGSILLSSFLVYYLEKSLGDAPAIAGAVSALTFVVPIFSSPFGGRVYDRSRRFRSLFVASGSVSAVATVITGFGGVYGPILACVLAGFVSGLGFTVVMSLARESRALGPEFRILSIAWVNSVSLTTSFIPPIVFSTIAGADGYTAAWVSGGVLAFALMLPALLIKVTK